LWTAVLEKAITAFTKEGRYDPQGADYGRLGSGLSHIAFRALLGVEATLTLLTHHEQKTLGEEIEESKLKPLLRGHESVLLPLQAALFGALVKPAELPLFYQNVWGAWVNETQLSAHWSMSIHAHISGGGVYRQEDFERFMLQFANQHESAWNLLQFKHDLSTLHLHFRLPREAPTALRTV
jgi:hypothetical protein